MRWSDRMPCPEVLQIDGGKLAKSFENRGALQEQAAARSRSIGSIGREIDEGGDDARDDGKGREEEDAEEPEPRERSSQFGYRYLKKVTKSMNASAGLMAGSSNVLPGTANAARAASTTAAE
jgi:hypothetical protein